MKIFNTEHVKQQIHFLYSKAKENETIKKVREVAATILACSAILNFGLSISLAIYIAPVFLSGVLLSVAFIALAKFIDPTNTPIPSNKDVVRSPNATISPRLFYHKILASGKRRAQFEGNTNRSSLDSIIEDLKCYSNKTRQPEKYETLIEDFTFALKLIKIENPSIAAKVLKEQILNLPPFNENQKNPSVLIPGGFIQHAILYVIQKEEKGTYKFSVINTGSGAIKSPILIGQNGEGEVPENSTQDRIYVDLPESVFSEEFFKKLLEKKRSEDSMKNIWEFIDTNLKNKEGSNRRAGRNHSLQKNGTCSMKCLMAYIRLRLGEEEYAKFKVGMTESNLEKFQNYVNLHSSENPDFQEMLAEGKQFLEKRKRKLPT